jgi:ribonuclease BN (tRNA processing enzyme)
VKVIVGGVRGTSMIAQPDFMRYGGDTTAVLVEGAAGERILIDAGTGIRRLGQLLENQNLSAPLLMLITHYHLDHLIGLPSFSLLFRSGLKLVIASPRREGRAVRDVISQIMSQPYWPVRIEDVHADVGFLDLPDAESRSPHCLGHLEVRWRPVHHPGGCTAYRIDEPATGRSFVFATDIEWSQATPAERESFLRLCREPSPPSLLVFDGQFRRDSYARYAGWGHSAWEDAVDVARAVKAKLLLVTHHAPQASDEQLDRLGAELGAAAPDTRLARAGMEIVL